MDGLEKVCSKCGVAKPLTEYWNQKRGKFGKAVICKSCRKIYLKNWYRTHREQSNANTRKWRAKNPGWCKAHREQERVRELKKRYNMGHSVYEELLRIQCYECAICGEKFGERRGPRVDHDHLTGKVRGLLCNRCNVAVGMARDSPAILRTAAIYLESHRDRKVATIIPAIVD